MNKKIYFKEAVITTVAVIVLLLKLVTL